MLVRANEFEGMEEATLKDLAFLSRSFEGTRRSLA